VAAFELGIGLADLRQRVDVRDRHLELPAGEQAGQLGEHLGARPSAVVNMASLNGSLSFKLLPSRAHMTNKAAIIGMTRQLALEGSKRGIRVNSISPGLIEGGATREQLEDAE
jgi:NAD(P)-dependent dehydrogenase (short-subunit alcohol dehydrogenase family)